MDLRELVATMSPEQLAKAIAGLSLSEAKQFELLNEGLLDFIPRVSPQLESPRHLSPLVELLEQTAVTPQKATVSTPPQHGKSQTCMHALIWLLLHDPAKRHAYVTYEATRAERHNEMLQVLADKAGLKWKGNRQLWRTPQGGGVVAAGIGGPLTGEPVDGVMLIDDPVKNQVDASSALMRERADEWFKTVATTRCHPSASRLVVQTRWHEDDLAGRLNKREGWGRINLPAINDAGEALWPGGRPLPFLLEQKAESGEYVWASLWQGAPRPRGGRLFGDATLYTQVPPAVGFRPGIGVDLAYTKKTHADYSVAVVLVRFQPTPAELPLFYVLDVRREQVKAPEFKSTLRTLRATHPGAPLRWYAAGAENGIGDFIKVRDGDLEGIPIEILPAKGDKFQRAQPVAAAWNAGRILVPEKAPWVPKFLEEINSFTGVNDVHDDQVDALGTAYDLLGVSSAASRFAMLSSW